MNCKGSTLRLHDNVHCIIQKSNYTSTLKNSTVKLLSYWNSHLHFFNWITNFLLLIIDDFHFVHTIKEPKQAKLRETIHMGTGVVDDPKSIPAVSVSKLIHQDVHVMVQVAGRGIVKCLAGINPDSARSMSWQKKKLKCFIHSFEGNICGNT
jgi:hypothetical protein